MSAISSNKSTGVLGVHFEKNTGRYIAHINVAGKYKNLGRYASAEDAQAAYLAAKASLHAGYVPERAQALKAQLAAATTPAEVEAVPDW